MHGRVKKEIVEPTPEELAKQKEQVRTARALFAKLLDLRKARTYSPQTLDMTFKALSFHPEFPTLWGYRRELLGSEEVGSNRKESLEQEMRLLEKALRRSQKIYSIWFHRRWAIEQLFEACISSDEASKVLDTELELCGRLFEVDERNFHCWNHRAHVMGLMRRRSSTAPSSPQLADGASGDDTKEKDTSLRDFTALDLKLSTDLINRNFSNYSAWHLRALLQQPSVGAESTSLSQAACIDVAKELEWVQQGIYTEPNDQSVWLYHHWLTALDRGKSLYPRISHCAVLDGELLIFFSAPTCPSHVDSCVALPPAQAACLDDAPVTQVTVHTTSAPAPQSIAGQLAPHGPDPASRDGAGPPRRTRRLPTTRQRRGLAWRFVPEALDADRLREHLAADGELEVEVETSVQELGSAMDGGPVLSARLLTFRGLAVRCDVASSASGSWSEPSPALTALLGPHPSVDREALLHGELRRVEELLEIEPDCRWALLARGRLVSAAAAAGGARSASVEEAVKVCVEGYKQISSLDPLRRGFYEEAQAECALRLRVLAWLAAGPARPLNVSNLSLRHPSPTTLLSAFGVRSLVIEDNRLQELGPILLLSSLEELSVANNHLLGDVTEAFALPRLRRLDVSGNRLWMRSSAPQVADAPKQLEFIDASRNPAVIVICSNAEPPAEQEILGRLFSGADASLRDGWMVDCDAEAERCVCSRSS